MKKFCYFLHLLACLTILSLVERLLLKSVWWTSVGIFSGEQLTVSLVFSSVLVI